MKSTRSNGSGTSAIPYPKLMIRRVSRSIIFMEKEGVGVVISIEAGSGNDVGYHYNKWDMSVLDDYVGSVYV